MVVTIWPASLYLLLVPLRKSLLTLNLLICHIVCIYISVYLDHLAEWYKYRSSLFLIMTLWLDTCEFGLST